MTFLSSTMFGEAFLGVLVKGALGLTASATLLLLGLLIRDWRRGELW